MVDPSRFDPRPPVTSQAAYLDRWSELHGDIDPRSSRLIATWLQASYAVARPVVSCRISADVVTVIGAAVAWIVPVVALLATQRQQNGWLVLAVTFIAIAGVIDNLDGAVAVVSGRTTRWGYVLDSICDRISEAAFAVTLWILGAPAALVFAMVVIWFLQEYLRARAMGIGLYSLPLTISERPTRIAIVAVFTGLVGLALYGQSGATWATIGAWAAVVIGSVGLIQLLRSAWLASRRPGSK